MIEIRARSPRDGWAFVQEDGATFLLYPPYRTRRAIGDPRAIERAVTTHGFEVDQRQFRDWASLVQVLADEYVASAARRTAEVVEFDVIDAAPAETLRAMVRRVVEELIPAADFDAAERLLGDILASRAAAGNEELRVSAVDALRRLSGARQQARARMADLLDMTARIREFAPLASERYTAEAIDDLATHVRERGLWSLPAA